VGLVKAQFMTISALIVAAIGLSVIAIFSTNHSNTSVDEVSVNYMNLIKDDIRREVDLNNEEDITRFEKNLNLIDTYEIEYKFRNKSSDNCYELIYRENDRMYAQNCIN
jgi:signal transduction histidine kinase